MRYLLIFISIFFFLSSNAYSEVAKQIISNLEKTKNYSFKFVQIINQNKETGNCILVFDKKINCKYEKTGKILVSDGKKLIIKSGNSNVPNFYKLENTYFYNILDKNYLINQLLKNSVQKEQDKLFVNVNYQNIDIKIFFDKEKLYLKGWETRDIYNNFVSTEIYIREVNKIFDENLFNLNKYN